MKRVYKWTSAKITEKLEYNSHSMGSWIIPKVINVSFTKPFLPKRGIQDTIRITLDVQKGIVQIKNKVICNGREFT